MTDSTVSLQESPAQRTAEESLQSRRNWRHLLVLVALWAAIYVPGLSTPALLDDADSVHAEAAREMVLSNDWVTLHANGIRYLEKAPLMYWANAVSFKLFGVHEWSARLPIALGMLALVLATYSLGRHTMNRRAGLWAAVILVTSFGPYIFTRIQIPDILVGLWLTLGFDFFLQGLRQERPSLIACWALAATAALNVLTKGLIGLVFPIAIIFLFLLLTRNLRHLLRMRLVSSVLVFLAIAAPWHILAGIRNPASGGMQKGFFWFYFINEHVLRYLNRRLPRDYDTVPFLIFWGLMLLWAMPWTAFLIQGLAQVPHRVRDYAIRLTLREQANLLFAVWALLILVFFSFSSRQEYYTIPAVPAVALLVGGWLAREEDAPADSPLRRNGMQGAWALLAIGILGAVAAVGVLASSGPVAAGGDISDLLKKNPEDYAMSLGHMLDLTPAAMGAFRTPLILFAGALLIGTVANFWLRRRGQPTRGNIALAIMMVVVLTAAHQGLVIFDPVLSSKPLALAIQQRRQPKDVIVINGQYEEGSTLNFYTGKQVHVLNNRNQGNMWYGSLFPDAPNIYEDDESLARLWHSDTRVWLWVYQDQVPDVVRQSRAYILASSGGKSIITNLPL